LTVEGSVTFCCRICAPSKYTVSAPPLTVTSTLCVPVRSWPISLTVLMNFSRPLLAPVAMPAKLDDG
jgi:hypothetical protein